MKLIRSIYLSNRLFLLVIIIAVIFVFGHFFDPVYTIGKIVSLLSIAILIIDFLLLYGSRNSFLATRETREKLSIGDNNDIFIDIKNLYSFPVSISIIDELPKQFQIRDFVINSFLKSREEKRFVYQLKPLERGEYMFGKTNIYVSSFLGLVKKRFTYDNPVMVPVYPSFIQMRKYKLLAVSNRLVEAGIKRIRRIGQHSEFDQVREYVKGDDYRTINWKATAHHHELMVNQYQDERSQEVYSLIDMGRVMKMPFEGMTLLDYSINASLVISNIAINKYDKAGLITFNNQVHTILPASRKSNSILRILEILYNQKTNFQESNFDLLYITVKKKINQRSLLILYTNFESLTSCKRQIKYLQRLSKSHLLLVIFFENTEIKELVNKKVKTLEDIYVKTIAEKFSYDKKLINKELKRYGIHTILTKPQNLTADLINKYLEFKSIGII